MDFALLMFAWTIVTAVILVVLVLWPMAIVLLSGATLIICALTYPGVGK